VSDEPDSHGAYLGASRNDPSRVRAPDAERPGAGHDWAPWGGALAGSLAAVGVALLWARRAAFDVPWLSTFDSRLTGSFDPLGGPIALFSTALLLPILVYAAGYLPERLAEYGVPSRTKIRFTGLMLGFGAAIVLLATAGDLLVLFVALELTAVASFLLIGLERRAESDRSAMVALVVTVGSSLLFLVGALMVAEHLASMDIAALRARVTDGRTPTTVAVACLAAGVIGKSAQMPLHFWLPRAMVAPTPISAYLHSATLVAAGVFVLARLRFLIETSPETLSALLVIGFTSVFAGGAMALTRQGLKAILAYSTIAQYGYAMVLLALGGDDGAFGVPFFLVAHGLPKCALFMVAGCVTHARGAHRLDDAAGVLRGHPRVAFAAVVAALGLAGFPLTAGFFKDELLFAAAIHASAPGLPLLAGTAAALTVAYAGRFAIGLLRGGVDGGEPGHELPMTMTVPPMILAVLTVVGGLWLSPLSAAFSDAASIIAGGPVHLHLGYHLRAETGIAALAWAVGGLLLATRRRWEPVATIVVDAFARRVGPGALAERLRAGVARLSHLLHRTERRDLRERFASVLLPMGLLVGLGLWGAGAGELEVGTVTVDDLPLVAGLLATAAAAVAAARQVGHLALVLVLSFVGFTLALTLALEGAPDVALILVIVETVTTLLFIAVLSKMRPAVLDRARSRSNRARTAGPWVAWVGGLTAFLVAWSALGAATGDRVAWEHLRLTPAAHGGDAVTVILADFRGLDTAGEITAFAVAVLGAAAIGWARR